MRKPFRCGWCHGAQFFVYGDRNNVECVKCRAVFHVYPLAKEEKMKSRFSRRPVADADKKEPQND
jgi:hypothetical protein